MRRLVVRRPPTVRARVSAIKQESGRYRYRTPSCKREHHRGGAIALNDFAQAHPAPTLIKIDVEGAEADVLRGSEEIFARSKPVLICEVHHGQAAEDVTRWLNERGYTFEWLEASSQFPRHLLARSGI